MDARNWLQAIAIGRRPKRTLIRLGVLVLLAFVVFGFVLKPIRITGPSMMPTFKDGGINFINRLAYLRNEPQRGDIVGIRYSGSGLMVHVMLVKRIVGLPGETVGFQGGRFYVNGKPLDEPYLKLASSDWNSETRTLGPREYYVVGDNRSMPFHYHYQGVAERWRIIGRVLFPGGS